MGESYAASNKPGWPVGGQGGVDVTDELGPLGRTAQDAFDLGYEAGYGDGFSAGWDAKGDGGDGSITPALVSVSRAIHARESGENREKEGDS